MKEVLTAAVNNFPALLAIAFCIGFITTYIFRDEVSNWRHNRGLKWVCSWCHPGVTGPNITHGICRKHAKIMRMQLKERIPAKG